jgi:hypothetical protein
LHIAIAPYSLHVAAIRLHVISGVALYDPGGALGHDVIYITLTELCVVRSLYIIIADLDLAIELVIL